MSTIIHGPEQERYIYCECCRERMKPPTVKLNDAALRRWLRWAGGASGYEAGKWIDICGFCRQAADKAMEAK